MKRCATCTRELVRKRYGQRMESLVEFAKREHCGYACIPQRRAKAQANNRSTGEPGISRYRDRGVIRIGVFVGKDGDKAVRHITLGKRPTRAKFEAAMREARAIRERIA